MDVYIMCSKIMFGNLHRNPGNTSRLFSINLLLKTAFKAIF